MKRQVDPEKVNTDVVRQIELMAATFKCRNKTYKSNWEMVAPIMEVLYPEGVPADVVADPIFHLLVLKLVKLTRFVKSGLTHLDSMDDDAVYSAMISSIIRETEKEDKDSNE